MSREKKCFVTGSTLNLHKHHIYMGAFRKKSEHYGCWVWLREDWHNMSEYGVHFNHVFDLELKQMCQRKFEEIHGHEKFMEVFKKNYL